MVDREARDAMVGAMERYLNEEITAFEFDDALSEIETEDETVSDTRISLWFFYDDCKDHKVVATKEDWDFLHRIILVLKSSAHIKTPRRMRWTMRQPIAACCLLLYGVMAYFMGFGSHLLFAHAACGIVSMGLAYWRYHPAASPSHRKQQALAPFSSVSELLAVRRKVRCFTKGKYSPAIEERRIRNVILNAAMLVVFVALPALPFWLTLSPLVLFGQSIGEVDVAPRVVMPESPLDLGVPRSSCASS